MVERGWAWTIILASVESTWPSLPGLIEAACNSTSATYEGQNEIQLMAAILPHVKMQGAGVKHDFPALALDLCHGGTTKSYATAIGIFVQAYGGHWHHVKK